MFGQLGSISLNMKGAGMAKAEVIAFVTGICKRSQLTEDQESELLRHVDVAFDTVELSSSTHSSDVERNTGIPAPSDKGVGLTQSASSEEFDLL